MFLVVVAPMSVTCWRFGIIPPPVTVNGSLGVPEPKSVVSCETLLNPPPFHLWSIALILPSIFSIPSKIFLSTIGSSIFSSSIASFPSTPSLPSFPFIPSIPSFPEKPLSPLSPFSPFSPVSPLSPFSPVSPLSPFSPRSPTSPLLPSIFCVSSAIVIAFSILEFNSDEVLSIFSSN